MTRLFLVRHAESTWNSTGRYQGRIDTELSDMGERQAGLVAQRFSAMPLAAIYSSPLRRAFHTALAIALAQGQDVKVEPDLIEIDHGAWSGLLKDEVEKRYGPMLQLWLESPSQVKMPGGESLEDVRLRSDAALKRLLEAHPQDTLLLCTHDAVLKVLLADALGMSLDGFWKVRMDNASVSLMEFGSTAPRLLLLNDTCHLGKLRTEVSEQAL
ncbi:MAG: histidine phosphatase family protein [Chloroflexi bacterium]|nr:histidine phosphatase family protein [Chloroflexota bacterium]